MVEIPIEPFSVFINNDGSGKGPVWDNVHWWGAGSGFEAGSAPGSFHAFHLHWRWAAELMMPADAFLTQPAQAGEQQFIGEGYGGVLLDPRIDKQELQIAVIKNTGLPASIHSHRTDEFKDFFINLRSNKRPIEIQKGEDLILYYSAKITLKNRTTRSASNNLNTLEGVIFVHGIFFAHGDEKGQSKTGAVGNFYLNTAKPDKSSWTRYPTK
jgi:hypothetical protein